MTFLNKANSDTLQLSDIHYNTTFLNGLRERYEVVLTKLKTNDEPETIVICLLLKGLQNTGLLLIFNIHKH